MFCYVTEKLLKRMLNFTQPLPHPSAPKENLLPSCIEMRDESQYNITALIYAACLMIDFLLSIRTCHSMYILFYFVLKGPTEKKGNLLGSIGSHLESTEQTVWECESGDCPTFFTQGTVFFINSHCSSSLIFIWCNFAKQSTE